MITLFGNSLLLFALSFTIYGIFSQGWYIRKNDFRFFVSGYRAFIVSTVFISIATLALLNELLNSNFALEYVAKYSSRETPFIYKFGGLWAGMEGSLLFWLATLSFFFMLVIVQNLSKNRQLFPWAVITLGVIQFFFLVMSLFFENPFTPISSGTIPNGMGLNPLLQHPAMLVHPPMLYFGFIGFSVPFAFAIAAMMTKQLDTAWIMITRRWTLVSWLLLTISIIMGGKWAYVELGWGGYWAWDPVENASLLPWFTATAYLHSVLIQEKKNMLRVWNMVLIMLTFSLTIFGTYITRSGVVSSVHAFAATNLGIWFLGFMIFIVSFNAVMLIKRRKELTSDNKLESFISRESGFLFNNMLFIAMMLTVLWGTMYPMFSEAVTGIKITVGSPYFNRIMIPLGLLTLLLTGIGPLLAWRKTSGKSIRRNFLLPILLGLVVSGIFGVVFEIKLIYPLISILLITFVAAIIFSELLQGTRARMRITGQSLTNSFFTLIVRNRSRYGGYIVHLGMVMMFVGFTGKAFDKEADVSMMPGDIQTLDRFDISYINYWAETPESNPGKRSNHIAKVITLQISKSGKHFTDFNVEKRFYTDQKNQPHSEVSVKSTLKEDFYVVMGGLDMNTGQVTLKIRINPLVAWVWLGTFVVFFGIMICINFGALLKKETA